MVLGAAWDGMGGGGSQPVLLIHPNVATSVCKTKFAHPKHAIRGTGTCWRPVWDYVTASGFC